MKPLFNPPTLRPDLPNYPSHLQLLRVTGGRIPGPSGSLGQSSTNLGVIYPYIYLAVTQQLATDTLLPRDREPCLVSDVRGTGLLPGYYLGRLAGTFQSLPLYEVYESATTYGGFSGARVSRQSDQSIPSTDFGSETAIEFDNQFYDEGGYWNHLEPTKFIVPQSGFYHIGGTASFDPSFDYEQQYLLIYRNGSILFDCDSHNYPHTSGAPSSRNSLLLVTDARLFVGQYIELRVSQRNSGGIARNVISGDCHFWIHLIK